MLEVTILKTQHLGEQEARKLLPYVQSSDAFGIEFSENSIETAREIEESWDTILGKGISRSKFLGRLGSSFQTLKGGEYLAKALDYVFRNRVALYLSERWADPNETKELARLYSLGVSQFESGLRSIHDGNISEGLKVFYEGEKNKIASLIKRDRNIAENLLTAEANLRGHYTLLRDVDPIRLGIQIGANHHPERYVSMPVKVVRLDEHLIPVKKLINQTSDLIYDGASLDEVAPLILEFAKQTKGLRVLHLSNL